MLTFDTYPIAKELLIEWKILVVNLARSCQTLYMNEMFFTDITPFIAYNLKEKQELAWQIVAMTIVVEDYEDNQIV